MANRDESKLNYFLGDTLPEPGRAIEVADGVKWARLPLPFALDHVNVWLLRDEIGGRKGWTLIDCGVDRADVRQCWDDVLERELEGLPVLRVVVTHMHPDHVGLAHWLCARWNTPLWMTQTDYAVACLWSSSQAGAGSGGAPAAAFFAQHGLRDQAILNGIAERSNYYGELVPAVPSRFVRMLDGDTLHIGGRAWRVIVGYGHAPEHASFHCGELNVLISGDMVLPRISTNVSVFDYEPEGDPVTLYLKSLNRYHDLAEDARVLPSHGKPFIGLHERIAQQQAHHASQLQAVWSACRERACTAADILPVMFKRTLDAHQTSFAMGEAIAHLNALTFTGRLRRLAADDATKTPWRFEACE